MKGLFCGVFEKAALFYWNLRTQNHQFFTWNCIKNLIVKYLKWRYTLIKNLRTQIYRFFNENCMQYLFCDVFKKAVNFYNAATPTRQGAVVASYSQIIVSDDVGYAQRATDNTL